MRRPRPLTLHILPRYLPLHTQPRPYLNPPPFPSRSVRRTNLLLTGHARPSFLDNNPGKNLETIGFIVVRHAHSMAMLTCQKFQLAVLPASHVIFIAPASISRERRETRTGEMMHMTNTSKKMITSATFCGRGVRILWITVSGRRKMRKSVTIFNAA